MCFAKPAGLSPALLPVTVFRTSAGHSVGGALHMGSATCFQQLPFRVLAKAWARRVWIGEASTFNILQLEVSYGR